jgi:hypothetical protein
VKAAITERLRGDAESTRTYIRDMLNDLPKVASYMGLNENLAGIEAIRILIERHLERFGGAGACVDADFKNALKRSFTKGATQIDVARITIEQMRGDTTWMAMKTTMHELINSNLSHIMPTVPSATQPNVPQLRFTDGYAAAAQSAFQQQGGAASGGGTFQDGFTQGAIHQRRGAPSPRGGGTPSPRPSGGTPRSGNNTPRAVCDYWANGATCPYGARCRFKHGDKDSRFLAHAGQKRSHDSTTHPPTPSPSGILRQP